LSSYSAHIKSKNIDIKISAHDAVLEWPSSGTLKVKIFESQIISVFVGNQLA
jgi:hypothetical protein